MYPEDRFHIITTSPAPNSQTAGNYKKAGFTLLELIIVIFLITLILGLSGVFFANTLPSGRFNAASRDMVSTMRQAGHLARIKGERQVVTIDIDSRRYGIEGRRQQNLPAGTGIRIIDPRRGEIVNGRYQMVFYSAGGADAGTVVLWNNNKTAHIDIDPVAGAVIIK